MKEKKRIEIDTFNNFNSSNNIHTEKFYNFFPSNKLSSSQGVAVAKFPKMYTDMTEEELDIEDLDINSVCGVSYFKMYFPDSQNTQHRILIYGDDNKVYINQLFSGSSMLLWLFNLQFNSPPVSLSYKTDDTDSIILTSSDKMVVWHTNYSPYEIENVPIITSMCMNDEVLFCTIKDPAFKIWYATNLDAENVGQVSAESGYISLEDDLGYSRKILTFNEDIYVFRDYGISKINYIKNDISVSQIYLSNTKIYADTVSICGNVIMFMTKDGIYSFNGVKVTKTDVNIKTLLPSTNEHTTASSLGQKYYLALRLNFNDNKEILCETGDYVNNALVIIDIIDYSYEIIRGVDIKSLLPVKTELFEKMLVTFNTINNSQLGQIVETSSCFDTRLPKYWQSSNLTNNFNTKLFTKLSIQASENVTFNLIYDDKNISFSTYKDGLNEFCFKILCKQVKLEISSNETNASVDKVVLDYYEY